MKEALLLYQLDQERRTAKTCCDRALSLIGIGLGEQAGEQVKLAAGAVRRARILLKKIYEIQHNWTVGF